MSFSRSCIPAKVLCHLPGKPRDDLTYSFSALSGHKPHRWHLACSLRRNCPAQPGNSGWFPPRACPDALSVPSGFLLIRYGYLRSKEGRGMYRNGRPPYPIASIGRHQVAASAPIPILLRACDQPKCSKIHHNKHHQSYVDGLNEAEAGLARARAENDFPLIKHWKPSWPFMVQDTYCTAYSGRSCLRDRTHSRT